MKAIQFGVRHADECAFYGFDGEEIPRRIEHQATKSATEKSTQFLVNKLLPLDARARAIAIYLNFGLSFMYAALSIRIKSSSSSCQTSC